jgi:hypothetical protein
MPEGKAGVGCGVFDCSPYHARRDGSGMYSPRLNNVEENSTKVSRNYAHLICTVILL